MKIEYVARKVTLSDSTRRLAEKKLAKVEKYFSENGYHLPETVILDDGDIAEQLNIYLIPRIILIDREFNIYRDGDTISGGNLKDKLQEMLATKK